MNVLATASAATQATTDSKDTKIAMGENILGEAGMHTTITVTHAKTTLFKNIVSIQLNLNTQLNVDLENGSACIMTTIHRGIKSGPNNEDLKNENRKKAEKIQKQARAKKKTANRPVTSTSSTSSTSSA